MVSILLIGTNSGLIGHKCGSGSLRDFQLTMLESMRDDHIGPLQLSFNPA